MAAPGDMGSGTGTLGPHVYPPGDVALAIATAALVLAGSALVLRESALRRHAAAPEIDIGAGAVVKVIPMLDVDAPLLKLGGGRAAGLPERWKVKRPKGAVSPPAPGAKEISTAAPEASKPKDEARGPAAANTSDAGAEESGGATGTLASGEANSPDAGEGVIGAPPGPGSPEGSPEGTETDPLKGRALDVYRARLVAWFSSRFRVRGSGLPQSVLTRLRAGATVQITAGGRVAGYSIQSSGNAVFDAAARAALEGAKGQALPPPPENYPDLAQAQISLVFVCKEGRCD